MSVFLSFFGAASTVTGSCYVIEHEHGSFMVDCGLFQGTKTVRELNYRDFPFKASSIDRLLLTHAHIDHTGLVPKLFRQGYEGPVFVSEPTADLLEFMLPDSGHIQEFEVKRLNERNRKRGRPLVEPIYTRRDAARVIEQMNIIKMDEWFDVMKGVRARYWNAGHILGSASIEIEVGDPGHERPLRLLFSGDIGPDEKTFHDDPSGPVDVDYLICESTYGDRNREDLSLEGRRDKLQSVIREALERGGNLVIPAFAVERTQELLYSIVYLMENGRIPDAPIFIDSPLAIKVTEAFSSHREGLHVSDPDMRVFKSQRVRYTLTPEESKAINRIKGGAIILSASGMCDAGRIRHHLKNNLWRDNATILFAGYQSPGSLGHAILRGEPRVRIHGEEISVKANIQKIDSYSAHADQQELIDWVKNRLPVHNSIFLSHGDPDAMAAFREVLGKAGCDPDHIILPEIDDQFELKLSTRPSARHGQPKRISHQDASATEDWHNEYARLMLDLSRFLQEDEDASKASVLKELRNVLSSKE